MVSTSLYLYNNRDSDPIHSCIGPTCIFQSESSRTHQLPVLIDSGAFKGLSPLCDDVLTFNDLKQRYLTLVRRVI